MAASVKKSPAPNPVPAAEWKVGFFLGSVSALAMLVLSLFLAQASGLVLGVAWLFVGAFLIGGLLAAAWIHRECSRRRVGEEQP